MSVKYTINLYFHRIIFIIINFVVIGIKKINKVKLVQYKIKGSFVKSFIYVELNHIDKKRLSTRNFLHINFSQELNLIDFL